MADPRIHPSAFVEDGAKVGDDTSIWHGAQVRSVECDRTFLLPALEGR